MMTTARPVARVAGASSPLDGVPVLLVEPACTSTAFEANSPRPDTDKELRKLNQLAG
jgi:hypothetical protein